MITAADQMALQAYSLHREEHRRGLAAHCRVRTLGLGPHLRLQFEDELTVRHRIQEALWAGPAEAAPPAIDAWARLVPNGAQWKATLTLEPPGGAKRARLLPLLREALREIYVELRCRGHAPVRAAALEEPAGPALRLLRFQIEPAFRQGLAAGGEALLGCSHPSYHWRRVIPPATLASLGRDLVQPARRSGPLPPVADDTA
ncbi:MAG: DUF3501 family protein [Pseudomonadota bacterium]